MSGQSFIGEPKQAGSADSAIRMAGLLAVLDGYCGAGAFMRTDDPASGQIVEAQTLRTFGEVDVRLLCS